MERDASGRPVAIIGDVLAKALFPNQNPIGEMVKITEGPFADFVGEIQEINEEKKKLKVIVKMIFNCTFTGAGNKNHVGNACPHRLFNRILNQWLIDNGQHFFWICFGDW